MTPSMVINEKSANLNEEEKKEDLWNTDKKQRESLDKSVSIKESLTKNESRLIGGASVKSSQRSSKKFLPNKDLIAEGVQESMPMVVSK